LLRVSAIVLAAGESRRMGTQKALLDWHGVPLIEYELEQLSSIDEIAEIIVVTGYEPAAIEAIVASHPRARAARNPAYASGKASSVLVGLRAVTKDADAILLCAVDQPRRASTIRSLLAAHSAGDAAITIPVHNGHRGHPLVFDAGLLPELLMIDEASLGVRAVVDRDAARVRACELDAGILLDLNRPDDLTQPPV
jgi:molybdenum cofactor cytidylyltransferase